MFQGLVDSLIQGAPIPWSIIAALWLVTMGFVVVRRAGAEDGPARAMVLLALASGTSAAAIPLSAAVAVPRMRWKTVDAPDLVRPEGETWRRLRGPAVGVTVQGAPDIAVPTIDAGERWVLMGLSSGRVVEGLPAAAPSPIAAGAARICRTEGEECRAWPAAWPPPQQPQSLDELTWTRASAGWDGGRLPLAYDTESGLFLRRIEAHGGDESGRDGLPKRPVMELSGRISTDAPRSGPTAIFVLRSVVAGRLRAMRVVSVPAAQGFTFHAQRADVALGLGPAALRWVLLVLLVTLAALPLGGIALAVAPLVRKQEGARRWMSARLGSIGSIAAGVAAAAPAVVAMASLWGSR